MTRRPLVLQLVHIPSDRDTLPTESTTIALDRQGSREESLNSEQGTSGSSPKRQAPPKQEYAEFLHTQSKKYYDFEDVRKEIEAETWVFRQILQSDKADTRMGQPPHCWLGKGHLEAADTSKGLLDRSPQSHVGRLAWIDQSAGWRPAYEHRDSD